MNTLSIKKVMMAMVLSGLVNPAYAHTGLGSSYGFFEGFMHPLSGIDHVLVMLAVGLWASLLGGRQLWLLPISFLVMMSFGASLQSLGFTLLGAEQWLALSVLVLGAAIWLDWQLSMRWASALVMVFALSHGYVHAAEMTADSNQLGYAAGFIMATACLHGLGLSLGLLSFQSLKVIRMVFAVICSAVGVMLMAGSIL